MTFISQIEHTLLIKSCGIKWKNDKIQAHSSNGYAKIITCTYLISTIWDLGLLEKQTCD